MYLFCQLQDPKDDVLQAELHRVQQPLEMCINNYFVVPLFLDVAFLRLFSASFYHDGQGISLHLFSRLPSFAPPHDRPSCPCPSHRPPSFVFYFALAPSEDWPSPERDPLPSCWIC